MVLGILLGAIVPMTIEWLGSRIMPLGVAMSLGPKGSEAQSEVFLILYAVAAATLLSIFGSTLTRGTIQALGAGAVACALAGLGIFAANHAQDIGNLLDVELWSGPLVAIIGIPVMLLTVVCLAYSNFKRVHPGRTMWLRNALALFFSATAIAVTSTVVYHRAWEAWIPEEPVHRLYGQFFYPPTPGRELLASDQLRASFYRMAVLLRDGRLWLRQRPVKLLVKENLVLGFTPIGRLQSGWLRNSKWRDIAVSETGCFGIQGDGTLWDLSDIQFDQPGAESRPKPFGESEGWEKLSSSGEHFTALKSDGTLSEWGYGLVASGTNVTSRKIPLPTQIGGDTDWTAVCEFGQAIAAFKAGGSVWRWGWLYYYTNNTMVQKFEAQPRRWLSFSGDLPVVVSFCGNSIAAVCEDGSLWVGGALCQGPFGVAGATSPRDEMVRISHDSSWSQVTFTGWGELVGLRRDGSLCIWSHASLTPWGIYAPIAPSQYSDWLSLCPQGSAFLALASNGSLCSWGNAVSHRGFFAPGENVLMMPSRIKATRVAQLTRN
jgi:hypothetical protein